MENLGKAIVFLCIVCVLIFWGGYELVDWLFVDDSIRSTKIINPEIELVVKNNVIDTIYVYRKP